MVQTMAMVEEVEEEVWAASPPPVAGRAVAARRPPGVFTVTRGWIVVRNEPDNGGITLTSAVGRRR